LTELEVNELLRSLEDEWPSNSYRFLSRNCCHFANEFCRQLRVGPLPDHILRLDIYASQEVVRIVQDGKEMRGRARTATFSSTDFCWGLAAYGRKAKYNHTVSRLDSDSLAEPADTGCCTNLLRTLLRPYYCMRGVRTFFRRVRKETATPADALRRGATH